MLFSEFKQIYLDERPCNLQDLTDSFQETISMHGSDGFFLFDLARPELNEKIVNKVIELLNELTLDNRRFFHGISLGFDPSRTAPTLPNLGMRTIVGTVSGSYLKCVDDLLGFLWGWNGQDELLCPSLLRGLRFSRDDCSRISYIKPPRGQFPQEIEKYLVTRSQRMKKASLRKRASFTCCPSIIFDSQVPETLREQVLSLKPSLQDKFSFDGENGRADSITIFSTGGLERGIATFDIFCDLMAGKLNSLCGSQNQVQQRATSGQRDIKLFVISSRYPLGEKQGWAYYTLRSGPGYMIVSDVLIEVALHLVRIWLELS